MPTTDPVADADAYGDKQDKINDAIEAAEIQLEKWFLALCVAGNAQFVEKAAQSHLYLDYKGGPSTVDLIQFVLDAANEKNGKEDAKTLIGKMAKSFAKFNVDESAVLEAM